MNDRLCDTALGTEYLGITHAARMAGPGGSTFSAWTPTWADSVDTDLGQIAERTAG